MACSDAPQSDLTKQQQDTGQGHKQAAIASAHPLATQAGLDILEKGGNAYDAAIATAAVLAVVEPYSAGMGGGGFWLLHDEATQQTRFIDAREKAPLAAHRDMYLDEDGNVIEDLSINGPMAAGIPGQAAAFAHIAKEYGNLPLSTSLAAAIQHAQNGFQIDRKYQILARWRLDALRDYPSAAEIFLQDNDVPNENHVLVQKDLAKTLTALANNGKAGFYEGPVAKQMVDSVQAAGGIWTLEDLKKYEVVEREPVTSEYRLANRQYKVTSAPPPSSGGIAIAQMFNMLEALEQHHEISWSELDGADEIHLLSEVMRRAYYDRAHYLGDSDFVQVPTDTLLDKQYAKKISKNIKLGKATKSADLGTQQQIYEGFHTTHLSVIDQDGNRVSATLSINLPFGSAYLAEGTGLLLNNEMDDFSVKPGVPNAYGLVGNEANAIAAEKRPLSSMSPSFIETEDKIAIIGTPGGSRIITMVFLGMLEYVRGNPVEDWVSRPRFHHQYLPDVIQYEKDSLTLVEIASLKMKGHELKEIQRQYGNMQAILWDKKNNKITAAADPRGVGSAEVRHIK
ncbi:gamma-glutamyltransferase [Bermanella marisrubri]|nr:gamma-glutamyltransferase [Bermanella marisrubri]